MKAVRRPAGRHSGRDEGATRQGDGRKALRRAGGIRSAGARWPVRGDRCARRASRFATMRALRRRDEVFPFLREDHDAVGLPQAEVQPGSMGAIALQDRKLGSRFAVGEPIHETLVGDVPSALQRPVHGSASVLEGQAGRDAGPREGIRELIARAAPLPRRRSALQRFGGGGPPCGQRTKGPPAS